MAHLPFLCGPAHQNPSGLGLGQEAVEARSPDAALATLLLCHTAFTPPAWAHCPVKKGNDGADLHGEISYSPYLCHTQTRQMEPTI